MTPSALTRLYLKDFRNYKEALISFNPGMNCIIGDNAHGKTNLLEAIHLLVTGRSFRTHRMNDLIRFGASSFSIQAEFIKNGVTQTLCISYDGQNRKIIHNATLLPKVSRLLGLLVGVVLSPEDRKLIKGGPIHRREFLDVQNAIGSPLYLHHLSRYKRALRHRNTLLKEKKTETLHIWEKQMAESAAFITLKRAESIAELDGVAHPLQSLFSEDRETFSLKYQSKAFRRPNMMDQGKLADFFMEQWGKLRAKELIIGQTLLGPHKDDLIVLLDGKEARLFGSEGQMQSAIAALRFASLAALQQKTSEIPLVCIDDIGVSLDKNRLHQLTTYLKDLGQVFITSPDQNICSIQANCIEIRSGQVCIPQN